MIKIYKGGRKNILCNTHMQTNIHMQTILIYLLFRRITGSVFVAVFFPAYSHGLAQVGGGKPIDATAIIVNRVDFSDQIEFIFNLVKILSREIFEKSKNIGGKRGRNGK